MRMKATPAKWRLRSTGINLYSPVFRVSIPLLSGLLLLLSSCGPIVPATAPAQLDHTPGPPIVVTDRTVRTRDYRLRYPSGWRVVTGEARLLPTVVLVAPDEVTTIRFVVGALPAQTTPEPDFKFIRRPVQLASDFTITVIGRAPADEWQQFLPIFEWVVLSLHSV